MLRLRYEVIERNAVKNNWNKASIWNCIIRANKGWLITNSSKDLRYYKAKESEGLILM